MLNNVFNLFAREDNAQSPSIMFTFYLFKCNSIKDGRYGYTLFTIKETSIPIFRDFAVHPFNKE